MKKRNDRPGDAAPSTDTTGLPRAGSGKALRRRAEEIVRKKAAGMAENVEALSADEVRRTLHELRVHQIELEMQNEELRRAQGELETARARYFELYDLAPVGYFTLGEAGLILEANLMAATLLGAARGTLVKQPISRFILREDHGIYYRHRQKLFEAYSTSSGQTGEPQACELRMVKMDGTAFWAFLEMTAAQDAGGASLCRVVLSDITERKQAEAAMQQAHDELEQCVAARTGELRRANEELRADIAKRRRAEDALRESEEKYRSFADSVDSMYLVDRDCTYLFMNEGHRMRFGMPFEEIIGRRYGHFHSANDTKEFAECIGKVCETGRPIIKEHLSERDGRYFLRTFTPVMGRGTVGEISKVVIVSKDITERKRAEDEVVETLRQLQETKDMLIQFERHAVTGRLAAGIAHEILNPASIISSRLQFLEEENLSEPVRENVRVSREQLQRIVKISHDLLQSSAQKPKVLVGGDLRRVIEVSLQMTKRRIKEENVQVEYDPPSEVIPIKMETDRLVKTMVNLIQNACDAMKRNQLKRLIIAVHRPEGPAKDHPIFFTVADNGHGILAEELDRIFEPFFTRKAPGKGTGLGLSVCKGIIQEHGGTIHAENNDMGGASFIVELPLDHPMKP